jgi:transcriptional regulator with XRE-family HTH domain
MSAPPSRNPDEDPAAALGETLKDLRLAAGFTTLQAAGDRLGYSLHSISKVETGTHVPTMEMLRLMLDLYRVPEIMRKSLLRQQAIARKARGPIPQFIEKWFSNEAKAVFLRLWALMFMPGQLQTREYARAMFLTVGLDEDEADEKADIRIGRQAIFGGPDPAHVTAIIHEHALHTLVGTPEIMIAQLEHLLEMSKRPNAVIQVIRDHGYFIGMEGPFEIASGEAIPDTLLMLAMEDQTMEDQALTRKAIALFEQIRGYALSVTDSRAVILEAIERWNAKQQ